jgi:hypothetical protein
MGRDKIVDYIICEDSDIMACGATVPVLKEKCQIYVKGFGQTGYKTAYLDKLLDSVGMEFDLFQELCIMSGTDFNKNIKGKGWGRSKALLLKHGSISRIGKKTDLDISILNHREVRKRFAIVPWKDTVKEYCLDMTIDEKRDLVALSKYDLAEYITELIKLKKKILNGDKDSSDDEEESNENSDDEKDNNENSDENNDHGNESNEN